MNTNIQTLTTIWCVLIFLYFSGNIYAQSTDPLFKVVSNAETVLSASGLNRYTDLDNDKIKEKSLIDITGLEQALQNSVLSVPLKGMSHSLRSTNFSKTEEGTFTFKGSFTEALGELYLYQTNGFLYGNIHIDSLAYQIEPINKKYAVLLRRDYSQYEACPLGETHDEGGKEKSSNSQQEANSKSMTNPTVDVMVLFSNQAAAATTDMQGLALGSIQSSNTTFSNSDAGVTFNLVHYQQVSYNESGSASTDRGRLIGTSDGYMDNVHSLRDQYGADVVALIISADSTYCGLAGGIGVGSSAAFTVVVDHCSIGEYTFAHEIGHLAGARHDQDLGTNPYPYGHGYSYNPAYWHTVMARNNGTTNRIAYWSNPNKYYGGVAMGTRSWNDNVRVWGQEATRLAGFKTLIPPSVSISGPGHISAGSNAQYTANVSGGISPYDYQWKKDGINVGSNSSSYLLDTDPSDEGIVVLSVTVTDDNNDTDSDNHNIFVDPYFKRVVTSTPMPEEYALSKNYPNPFNPSTQITYALPEASDVSIRVYNVMGQEVATLVDAYESAGIHELTFDAGNLSSGMYIAKMVANGASGEQFLRELKMQLIK